MSGTLDTEPYERFLEFAREEKAEDPHAFRFEAQEYRLTLEGGGVRAARFPWSEQFLMDLQALAQERPDVEAAKRLGEQLRRFLDALDWGGHEDALERRGTQQELRLVLRSAAAELYALPWELVTLKDSGLHLAELPGCTLRYEWPRERELPPRVETPQGRMLFAWSAAGGLVPAEGHLRALQQASRQGDFAFDPRQDVLPRVSLLGLEERLRNAREPVSVLHLLCHGTPLSSSTSRLYGLAWNESGGGGGVEQVDGGALAAMLAPYASTLRMVVLCACQGGDSGKLASHLGSVAQALHRAGIEMVLASRLPLSSAGSVLLAETLYRKLLVDSSSLEEALSTARRALRVQGHGFDWASLQLYARREGEMDLRPVVLRPYRGLLAFEPRHRRFFFGRAKLEAALLERVEQAIAGQRPCFQVVAGASGVGKSSVVMAGLVPRLPAEEWDWLVVRPGELMRAGPPGAEERSGACQELVRRLRAHLSSEALPAEGSAPKEGLVQEVRRLLQARPGRKLLLVMDQLEEVFTQLSGEDRQALMQGLWDLGREPGLGCVVVATLRVDHFERCGEVALDAQMRLDDVVYSSAHRLFVPQIGADEVTEAIEQPARKVGLRLEPGLVERLRRDVGLEPGALPLLGHALDLLWQRRVGRWLKHQTYEEMGGVTGALTQTAERLYEELSEAERQQTRRLLVRLVAVRDMGSPQAQGRVWVDEMRPPEGQDRAAFEQGLEKLVRSRLLVLGGAGAQAEEGRGAWGQLAHETLLRRWKRLEKWVVDDWEREQQLQELDVWAEDWEAHREGEDGGASYLLTGDRLGYAKRLRERHGEELSPRSRRLIEASEAQRERLEAEKRATQEREEQQRRVNQSTVRLLLTELIRRKDATQGLLLLREVDEVGRNLRWAGAVINALQEPVAEVVLRGFPVDSFTPSFSPDGQRLVMVSEGGSLWLRSVKGELLATLEAHHYEVHTARFSPDGRWLVTASKDGAACIWRMPKGELLARLWKDDGGLWSADFSPDGERVITTSNLGVVRVWTRQGTPLMTLVGHSSAVYSAAFSPDGQRVVTASEDRTARVWSAQGRLLVTFNGHNAAVISAAFSGDGQRVLTVSKDGMARIWTVEGELQITLGSEGKDIRFATFSPDGQQVVAASRDGTARIWTVHGELRATLAGHHDEVAMARFSPDSQRIVTASLDGTARIWGLSGEPRATLTGHEDPVYQAAFTPDGRRVVTVSSDKTVRIWSVGEGFAVLLGGQGGEFNSVAFSPDGQRLVTASRDGTARIWSVSGEQLSALRSHGEPLQSAAFSPDGSLVVVGAGAWKATIREGKVDVWSAKGEPRASLKDPALYNLNSVAFSPDGQRVMVLAGGEVQLWSMEGEKVATLGRDTRLLNSVAFSPDGQRVVIASLDKVVRVWSVSGALLATLVGHVSSVRSASFSPDGTRVVTASLDGTARLWSADGALLATLGNDRSSVYAAAFSPDGARIVTAQWNGAKVWNLSGELMATLKGHTGLVQMVTFSPDGQQILTASDDQTARLWSTGGEPLATLKGHGRRLTQALFSPDGQRVVTLAEDGKVRIWPISPSLLMERLETATRECLGVEERQVYLGETLEEARARHERCQLSAQSRP